MKINKTIAIPLLALGALTVSSAFGASKAEAFGFGNGGQADNGNSLIQRLADRFNLNNDELGSVIDEHRKELQGQRRSQAQERLQSAVEDGKMTQEQKDELLKKREQWQSQRDELDTLSDEERRERMEQHRDEMRQWMEDNDIEPGLLGKGNGMRNGGSSRGMARN